MYWSLLLQSAIKALLFILQAGHPPQLCMNKIIRELNTILEVYCSLQKSKHKKCSDIQNMHIKYPLLYSKSDKVGNIKSYKHQFNCMYSDLNIE